MFLQSPGGLEMSPFGAQCVYFRMVSAPGQKNLLTSRVKCSFASPPVLRPPKMAILVESGEGDLKTLYPSALELPLLRQPPPKKAILFESGEGDYSFAS